MAERFVIETANLRKRYNALDAVNGLDLRVPEGSICGFLGPNGAGKTTTIKMLLGMTRPTAGAASVLGRDAAASRESVEIRRHTAFVSDDKDLYGYMTVAEMIRFTASFFTGWRSALAADYVRRFELPLERRVSALSRGMLTKLSLLLALSRGAQLLVLDEPTTGLDPAATEDVLQSLVAHVAREQITVFFSSHQIAEIEQIADHVTIIDRGRLVLAGPLDDLRASYRRVHVIFDGDAPQATFRHSRVVRVTRKGRVLTVTVSGDVDALIDEARALSPTSIDVTAVSLKDMFLESVAGEN